MLRYTYIAYLVYNYRHVFKIEEPLMLMQLDEKLTNTMDAVVKSKASQYEMYG